MKLSFKKFVLMFFILFFSTLVFGQTKTVTGKISSQEDGKPLQGVSVVIKGTVTGTQTNVNGEFSIEAAQKDVLVFSYAGFIEQEINVGSQSSLSLSLKSDASNLGEVVVKITPLFALAP